MFFFQIPTHTYILLTYMFLADLGVCNAYMQTTKMPKNIKDKAELGGGGLEFPLKTFNPFSTF